MISHDRHFLNSVGSYTADIDYQTVIMYPGGYDDMVVAKTQIRSSIEAENAQREKKIEQLNAFIARFSAGTRSRQVTSRRKEVERIQTVGTGAVQHSTAVYPLWNGKAVWKASARIQGP